jgi:hypothetical protein
MSESRKQFSRDQIIEREFVRLARVIFEYWEEGRGGDTRFLDWLVSDEHVQLGRSKKGGGRREHIVPRKLIYDECERMFAQGDSIEAVAKFIRKNLWIAHITPEEARTLDVDLGLKVTMPPEWTFDEGDIRARLRHAGIEIEEP